MCSGVSSSWMPTARELNHQYRMRKLQELSSAWRLLVRFFCIAAVCLCFYFSVRELAGRQTLADLSFKVLADIKANHWMAILVSWCLTGTATAWGCGERYLRKRHIKRISSESSEMQRNLDPGRRSSHLSKKGETGPEDI